MTRNKNRRQVQMHDIVSPNKTKKTTKKPSEIDKKKESNEFSGDSGNFAAML